MDLLASTFDVESVVFLKRGTHFLAFYGPDDDEDDDDDGDVMMI